MHKKNMVHVHKTITIAKEQAKWVQDNHINLSRLVQEAITKRMNKNNNR